MTEHSINLTALAKSMIDGAHSIFSASGSHLWMHCAGGLIPNILAPDDSGSEAAEGTVAHGVGELWLTTGKKPRHLVGTTETVVNGKSEFEIEITHEMLDYVQQYVDSCWSLPGTHFVETKVYYDDLTPIPKQGGTADHAACWYQHLVISDLKYGKGVYVEVKNNPQLLLYAYGFFREWDWLYDFQEITIRVCQPRMKNMNEITITREELLAFAETARVASHKAWKLNAPRTPGDAQCAYCRVKGPCGAYAKYLADMTEGIYRNLEDEVQPEDILALKERIDNNEKFVMTPLAELTTEQMSILYSWRSSVEKWWNAVALEISRRAARGTALPHQKLVESRSRRKFRNEKQAISHLVDFLDLPRDEVVIESLATPAEVERVMRKNGFDEKTTNALLAPVVIKPPGKPTLAPMSDPRPALGNVDEGLYRDLTLTETEEP